LALSVLQNKLKIIENVILEKFHGIMELVAFLFSVIFVRRRFLINLIEERKRALSNAKRNFLRSIVERDIGISWEKNLVLGNELEIGLSTRTGEELLW
jgi:hypothetical protein